MNALLNSDLVSFILIACLIVGVWFTVVPTVSKKGK